MRDENMTVSFPVDFLPGQSILSPKIGSQAERLKITFLQPVHFDTHEEFFDYCESNHHPEIAIEVISQFS